MTLNPNLYFFGSLVDVDCHIQDLKLILRRTDEIVFPYDHEGESLIADCHPDTTRKSFIVSLIISLDSLMSDYCIYLRKVMNQGIKWNDLRGSPLERFIKYTEKVCRLSPVACDTNKQNIKALIELRNCIVHNNSMIEGFSKASTIKLLAKQVDGISIESECIELSFDACIECANLVHEFMKTAYLSALDRFPE